METRHEHYYQAPAIDGGRRKRLIGVATLVLIFCASASVAFAYFSDTDARFAADQVAAAASSTAPDAFATVGLIAQAAYVQDLTTGKVLYAQNAGVPLPLASLTKVATALAISEVLPSDSIITIPYTTAPSTSAEQLIQGQQWKVGDLLNFTLIASSNDGAEILASAADPLLHATYPLSPVAGATVWRMNELVRALGMHDMYFLNASGLDISATQAGAYGSARDVARVFMYAASTSPAIFEGTTKNGMLVTSVHGATAQVYNTDQALGSIPGLIMGKTGYTDLAGGNLAILFDVGLAHPVVAVVMGSSYDGRFSDMKQLVAATQAAVAQQ